jgi:hypothetical protein
VRRVKKTISLSIVLFLCLTMAFPFIKADAQTKPSIYVDPENNSFSTDTTTVGTNFTVSIKGADWASPGLFSYQLELHYNNTILEAVNAELPPDQWFKPVKPSNIFIVDPGTINQDLGFVSFAVTLLGDEQGKVGAGTISAITFSIIQAPPTGGNVTCPLEIENIIMVDANTAEVPRDQYDVVNGTYVYSAPAGPPPAKPAVYVDPKTNSFLTSTTSVGTNFTVSIKAANWTTPDVFSYQLTLYYNNTLLEAVDAKIPDDHWLKPAKPANIFVVDGGTINQTLGFVSFAVTLLSDEQGKVGAGTISTITFSIIQAPPTGGNVTCPLEIKDIILVDSATTEIPSDQYNIINGTYIYSAAAAPTGEDLNGDGKVNIEDIAIWGAAFGSSSGHPRWNPITDMNSDGKIDMIDAVLIAKAWTG